MFFKPIPRYIEGMARKLSSTPSAVGRALEAAATRAAFEAGARAEIAQIDPGGVVAKPKKRAVRTTETKKRAPTRLKVAG